jgi:hypothetical protein
LSQSRIGIVQQPFVVEFAREMPERAADVGCNQIQQLFRRRREPFDSEFHIQEQRRDLGS